MGLLSAAYEAAKNLLHIEPKPDYTKGADAAILMASSRNKEEWDANCRLVMEANGGGKYPDEWMDHVIKSGLRERKFAEFEKMESALDSGPGPEVK